MSPVRKGGVKPTGRVYTGKSDLGDGDLCPVNPEHGRMYYVSNSRQWCPHAWHSSTAGRLTDGVISKDSETLPDLDIGELS